jgi:tRNA(Arg) A34 adenosine deaminase TadA
MCSVSRTEQGRTVNHEHFMRLAVRAAEQGIAAGQTPFGAVIVRGDEVVAEGHNCVWLTTDPTAHAEVVTIRKAAAALKTINLGGTVMYTTCEPCPMCLSAIHWARIDAVHYGAVIADAEAAGFGELRVAAKVLAAMGGSPLLVEESPLRAECAALLAKWKAAGLSKPY